MEAVCILLGVKADWNTAKVLLGDPTLLQKVIVLIFIENELEMGLGQNIFDLGHDW